MRIFHIATLADWEAAQVSGSYTTSTIGRTLAEEGFLHASRGDQWQGVKERFYAEVTEPLVLLVIETDRLSVPVVEEPVGDSTETFPHVYGPLAPDAVVTVISLDDAAAPPVTDQNFSQVFLGEVVRRVLLALVVMGTAVLGALVGSAVEPDLGPSVGLLVGLVVGVGAAVLVHRRH